MGRGRDWGKWSNTSGYGEWRGQQQHAWHGKAAGKQGRWGKDKTENLFPTLEMMDAAEPKERSAGSKGYDMEHMEDTAPKTGQYVSGVQRLLNGVRKAEAKTRKLEEAQTTLEKKWTRFKESLKESFVAERAKYYEKKEKIKNEAIEAQQLKDAALLDLQMAFSKEEDIKTETEQQEDEDALKELEDLLAQEPTKKKGLTAILAGAVKDGSILDEKARAHLRGLIADHRTRSREARTPSRRRSRRLERTPSGSPKPAPARTAKEEEHPTYAADEGNGPYQASPSANGKVPKLETARSRSHTRPGTRTPIKLQGRGKPRERTGSVALGDKLDSKRAECLGAALDLLEETDEDELMTDLGEQKEKVQEIVEDDE